MTEIYLTRSIVETLYQRDDSRGKQSLQIMKGERQSGIGKKIDFSCFNADFHLCRMLARQRKTAQNYLFPFINEGPRRQTSMLKSARDQRQKQAEGKGWGKKYTKHKGGERKSTGVLDKRLGENTSTRTESLSTYVPFFRFLFSPFYALRAHRCRCIHSLRNVYARRRREKQAQNKSFFFRALSLSLSLDRKIVKHEVDGEINFTNPLCKKLETRKSLRMWDRKLPLGMK